MTTPLRRVTGCCRTGAGSPAATAALATAISRPLCAGRARSATRSSQRRILSTPRRPGAATCSRYSAARAGVIRRRCQASSAARSNRTSSSRAASPRSISGGAAMRKPSSRWTTSSWSIHLLNDRCSQSGNEPRRRVIVTNSIKRGRHPPDPVEPGRGGTGEETPVTTEQLRSHRPLAERRREVGQLDDAWQDAGKDAALFRSVDGAVRHARLDELANRRHPELRGKQSQRLRPVEYPTMSNGFHTRPGRCAERQNGTPDNSLASVTTLVAPFVPMTRNFPRLVDRPRVRPQTARAVA